MKVAQYTFLAILAVLMVAACQRHRYPAPLTKADSLIASNPDSAALLLSESLADTASWSTDAKMFHLLLTLEAYDLLDSMPTSDSTVLRLLQYYEHDGDASLKPRALYVAGKTYSELHDATNAATYYIKTIKEGGGKENALLRSRAYSQLGYMLSNGEHLDKALDMFKRSYEITSTLTDTVSIIFDLRDIARTYADKQLTDSALLIYNKALALAQKQGNKRMMASVNGQMAALYQETGNVAMAWRHLNQILPYDNLPDRSAAYSIAALLYTDENKLDSAAHCYEILTRIGNIYGKHQAHTWLSDYYSKSNETRKAAEHVNLSKLYADSVAMANAAAVASLEMAMFDNDALKDQNRKQSHAMLVIIVLSICAVSILLVALYRMRKSASEKTNAILSMSKMAHPQSENINAGLLATAEDRDATGKTMDSISQEDRMKATAIYKTIRRKLDKGMDAGPLSDSEWGELSDAVNDIYTDFRLKLGKLCEMSVADYHICLLIKIGLKLREISALVCLTPQGLASARSKLYNRAYGKKGEAKAWDNVVKSL